MRARGHEATGETAETLRWIADQHDLSDPAGKSFEDLAVLFGRNRDDWSRMAVLDGMRVAGHARSVGLARSVLDGGASRWLALSAIKLLYAFHDHGSVARVARFWRTLPRSEREDGQGAGVTAREVATALLDLADETDAATMIDLLRAASPREALFLEPCFARHPKAAALERSTRPR